MKKQFERTAARETVLVTTVGTSPSVLTSTIWALAHRERVLPNRVKVLTTRLGRDRLGQAVFTPSPHFGGRTAWENLCESLEAEGFDLTGRLEFAPTPAFLRVFTAVSPKDRVPRELDDITTEAENEQAADAMLETLRGVMADDAQIIASIAGGRKTVSALFYACVSLIGRSNDRIIHVVVNEPFDRPDLHPGFFFPAQICQALRGKGGLAVKARDCVVSIIEVPFVPMRNLFPKAIGHTPGKFSSLIAEYRQASSHNLVESLRLSVHLARAEIEVNDTGLGLGPREQLLVIFFAQRLRDGKPAHRGFLKELEDEIEACRQTLLRNRSADDSSDWRCDLDRGPLSESDIRRALSDIRTKLLDQGQPFSLLLSTLPKGKRYGLALDPKQVRLIQ